MQGKMDFSGEASFEQQDPSNKDPPSQFERVTSPLAFVSSRPPDTSGKRSAPPIESESPRKLPKTDRTRAVVSPENECPVRSEEGPEGRPAATMVCQLTVPLWMLPTRTQLFCEYAAGCFQCHSTFLSWLMFLPFNLIGDR